MQKQFIPRKTDRQFVPLSFAQERLWFLNQLEPENCAYNMARALRLDGTLDVGALRSALDAIVERHEVLRTTYIVDEGRDPIQQIGPPQAVELAIIDLSACPQSERDGRVQRMIADLTERLFDLRRDQMLRAGLLRLELNHHVLVVVMHHIASDGWSSGILWRELAVFYKAFLERKSVSLPELPIQYADYAAWQREWLSGTILASQLDYWKKQLQDLPTLQLPTDRPRPAIRSYRGARRAFKLSRELTQGIKRLSRNEGVTLFMTLLAAFQTLLSRYSGQEDICIGLPIANRNYVELEGLIGFFANTLVLRSDLSGKPTVRELLSKVKRTALQSYAHQDLPFEKLVEELRPERILSVSPLFQVMFALQNYPRNDFTVPELVVSPINIHQSAAKIDLTLALTETTDGFEGQLEYSTDLFDSTTVCRMLGHFQTLLEGIVTNPNQRISDLPLLTEPEKHQLLEEWNDTKRDYPSNKCIHQLFEEQVERTPGAVAIVFEDQQFTYRELNDRANQLGRYLRKLGVGPDIVVGMCLERSLEMVIALLGVLKSGGAYLPLDPTYPEARLGYMLNDSGVAVLLTFQALTRRLPKYDGQTVYLDQEWQKVAGESTANLPSEADNGNIAYVIYTSGSTGNPKGVAIPHSSICNHMMWMLEAFPLAQDDRVAQRTPLSFDASVWEFFAPLISGAQLVLARPEGYRDAEYLAKFLLNERITILQVGPTLLKMMLQENMAKCGSLRRVFCGGEPLSAELNTRFRRQLNVPLINLYGPTEAAIDATYYECRENDSPGWVPIGRPIANTQIYILDQYLAPVPIGVVGEIHIGGDGLARGYLNQPELTAEKFIYHSLGGEPPRRLYRTGDHARYLADGNIEFLGRIDHQIKIRGYRVELGEIETTLAQHLAIREAIAMVREDHSGDKRLVAYLVARREQSFDVSDVRKYLKQRLPEYMIPSALVRLDELPLTPSGKVDRGLLPAPGSVQRSEFIAPRTPVEEKIAEIWAEVLRVDRVGMDDNFFELGGHSLLATQVVSRMRAILKLDIPLRSLFEAPTVGDLATVITRQQTGQMNETEMERILEELESMSNDDAEQGYKDRLTKTEQ